jgi:hypothetical protein
MAMQNDVTACYFLLRTPYVMMVLVLFISLFVLMFRLSWFCNNCLIEVVAL